MASTTISHVSIARPSQGTWIKEDDHGLTGTKEDVATTATVAGKPHLMEGILLSKVNKQLKVRLVTANGT